MTYTMSSGTLNSIYYAIPCTDTNDAHLTAIFQDNLGKPHQIIPILDFLGAEDDRDSSENFSYKTCRAAVKSSPPMYHHPSIFAVQMPDALPVAWPTVSDLQNE